MLQACHTRDTRMQHAQDTRDTRTKLTQQHAWHHTARVHACSMLYTRVVRTYAVHACVVLMLYACKMLPWHTFPLYVKLEKLVECKTSRAILDPSVFWSMGWYKLPHLLRRPPTCTVLRPLHRNLGNVIMLHLMYRRRLTLARSHSR